MFKLSGLLLILIGTCIDVVSSDHTFHLPRIPYVTKSGNYGKPCYHSIYYYKKPLDVYDAIHSASGNTGTPSIAHLQRMELITEGSSINSHLLSLYTMFCDSMSYALDFLFHFFMQNCVSDTKLLSAASVSNGICLIIVLMAMFIMCKCPKHLSFNAVILMVIGGVSGGDEYCMTAYACVGQSMPMNATHALHSGGYKANSGGTTDITIDWTSQSVTSVYCMASFSCANIGYIRGSATGSGPYRLSCYGVFGCSNTTVNLTQNININCGGSNSCYGVTFNSPLNSSYDNPGTVSCSGDRSCTNAEFHNHVDIRAYAPYALYNATIHSTTDGLYVQLYASNSGFGARILCHFGHSCTIICNVNTACRMLYIDCVGTCDIQTKSIHTAYHPVTNYSLLDASQLNMLYDSSALAKSNDDACLLMFDDNRENTNADISGSNICCRGYQSCYSSNIHSLTSVVCSGKESCIRSDNITANDAIFCSGFHGCSAHGLASTLYSLNDVYCLGEKACFSATITAHNLHCSGSWSCSRSTIVNIQTIYFSGYFSGYEAVINCTGIAVCNIICDGYQSCSSIADIHCNECTVSCDRYTGCPPGYTSAPTSAPSSLSLAPTQLPNSPNYPTHSPFPSPTICSDINSTKISTNGNDIIQTNNNSHWIMEIYETFGFRVNTTHLQPEQVTNCGKRKLCLIQCNDSFSCSGANIVIANSDVDQKQNILIICDSPESCKSLTINITNSLINAVSILCNEERDSCSSLKTNVINSNINAFNVYCLYKWSCDQMRLYFNESDAKSDIFCSDDNACDNLVIIDDSGGVFVTFHMFKYSSNIQIRHPNITNINIQCDNPRNTRYIKYEIQQLPDERELLLEASKKYDSRYLPCHSIHIDCTTNEHFPQSSNTEYRLKSPYDLAALIDHRHDNIDCFWIELSDLFDVVWNGNCNDQMTYSPYNKSLAYDIIFRYNLVHINTANSKSEQGEALAICNQYFRNRNDTEDTLDSVDSIFELILLFIANVNPFLIHEIIASPLTLLRDGLFHVNCTNSFNELKIITNLSITSCYGLDNAKQVDKVFDDDGVFVSEAEKRLSEFFNVNISIQTVIIDNVIDRRSPEPFWEYPFFYPIIAGFVFLIICVILIVVDQRAKQSKRLRRLTTFITNPLVIAIAIGTYDKDPKDPEIHDLVLPDLKSIDKDIKNIVDLFGVLLSYKIFPKYNIETEIKTHWTKKEIFNLLKKGAAYLDESVQNSKHDGLIVIISCHGVQEHIITSDYKRINKDTIHRIFSVDFPSLRTIAGIFLYDCCDGPNDMIRDAQREDIVLPKQVSKAYDVQSSYHIDINPYGTDKQIWFKGEPNPDYKLVIINSSNKGFISHMGNRSGSFMIKTFTEKMMDNICNKGNKLFLIDVTDSVEEELHSRGKQLIDVKYNNKLRYIKFKRNEFELDEEEKSETEMDAIGVAYARKKSYHSLKNISGDDVHDGIHLQHKYGEMNADPMEIQSLHESKLEIVEE